MPSHSLPDKRFHEIQPDNVAAVFDSYPAPVLDRLWDLRRLILDTAATTEGVGPIEEALRWGEPSYLTSETKSGATIRIAPVRGEPGRFGMFVNCQTTLVGAYRQMYPDLFAFDGTRAITFGVEDAFPRDELRHCIAMALCYHLDKRRSTRP